MSKENKKKPGRASQTLCPAAKKCGGCRYQGVPYQKQLKRKQEQVEKLLLPFCRVYPVVGMEHPYHYRNKVHAVFHRLKNGTVRRAPTGWFR